MTIYPKLSSWEQQQTFFMSQFPWGTLEWLIGWFWVRVSHEVTVKMCWAATMWRFDWGCRRGCSLAWQVDEDCWQEASVSQWLLTGSLSCSLALPEALILHWLLARGLSCTLAVLEFSLPHWLLTGGLSNIDRRPQFFAAWVSPLEECLLNILSGFSPRK